MWLCFLSKNRLQTRTWDSSSQHIFIFSLFRECWKLEGGKSGRAAMGTQSPSVKSGNSPSIGSPRMEGGKKDILVSESLWETESGPHEARAQSPLWLPFFCENRWQRSYADCSQEGTWLGEVPSDTHTGVPVALQSPWTNSVFSPRPVMGGAMTCHETPSSQVDNAIFGRSEALNKCRLHSWAHSCHCCVVAGSCPTLWRPHWL